MLKSLTTLAAMLPALGATTLSFVPLAVTATPALASQDCPRGYRTEKLNQNYTCSLRIKGTGKDGDAKAARYKALDSARKAYAKCDVPVTEPTSYGLTFAGADEYESWEYTITFVCAYK